jgi:YHS domain-containing protein
MKQLYKAAAAFALILGIFFYASPVLAKSIPVYTGTFNSNAVSGYDTVAYFKQNKAVEGSNDFKTEHQGATWKFSSQENLDLFKANPDKYAPQYGGYCAYGLGAKDALVSSDPEEWKIVDGKLYLNYDHDVQVLWQENIPNYIESANKNWSKKTSE